MSGGLGVIQLFLTPNLQQRACPLSASKSGEYGGTCQNQVPKLLPASRIRGQARSYIWNKACWPAA